MLSIAKDGEYVGYCGIRDLSKEPWEIAIELLPKWLHQGIGFAVISTMLDALKEQLSADNFRVRIEPTHFASQRLFEELGAKPNGTSKFPLHIDESDLSLTDDAFIAVAKKFDVEPRNLLNHVLEYTLCWSCQ